MSLDRIKASLRKRRRADAHTQERATSALFASPAPSIQDESLVLADVENDSRGLDPEQCEAVDAEEARVVVEAQVGSGKTRVLAHRVAHWHRVEGVPLDQIVVLTFTRKAGRELGTRVAGLLGADVEDKGLRVGTFHSVARSLLSNSKALAKLGRRPGFEILDARNRRELLAELAATHGLKLRYLRQLDRRLEAFRQGQSLFGNMKHEDDVALLDAHYEQAKRDRNAFDFDDLVRNVTVLAPLSQGSMTAAAIAIDELQDCDAEQLDMIEALCDADTRIFAVGDPRQVIYSWRGSDPEIFEVACQRFGASRRSLARNYRSQAGILAVAGSILGARAGRLVATHRAGPRVVIRRHHDPLQEALFLVERCRALNKDGVPWSEMAVLYRTREQSEAIEDVFRRNDLRTRQRDALGSSSDGLCAWFEALLLAVGQGGDQALIRAFLTHPQRGHFSGRVFDSVVDAWNGGRSPQSGDRRAIVDFIEASRELGRRWSAKEDIMDVDTWWSALDLDRWLHPTRARYRRDRETIRAAMTAWMTQVRDGDIEDRLLSLDRRGGLVGFLAHEAPSEAVSLMTLHAAKGLEFDYVFLSGINEGLVPLISSRRDRDASAEERRLLFVGLTRAKKEVEVGYFNQCGREGVESELSSFFDLVPANLLDRRDLEKPKSKAPELTVGPWQPGAKVVHRDYGEGAIETVTAETITCRFERLGSKKFSVHFCPLQVIDGPSRDQDASS